MRALAFLVGCLVFAATGPAGAGDSWLPTMGEVRALESKVRLPTGASPLAAYVRFYTGVVDNGHKVIEGVYLARSVMQDMNRDINPDVNLVIANDMPFINDGGCLMVTLYYDVDAGEVTSVHCNGFA